MHPASNSAYPQAILDLLNQVFEVEKKLSRIEEPNSIERNVRKMREVFENGNLSDGGLIYHNPLNEPYNETRTDCEASIAGEFIEGLVIIEVIKPIIYLKQGGQTKLVQKAVVIAGPPVAAIDPMPPSPINSNDQAPQ